MDYAIVVVGNGETSRANVEALIEDHCYANGGHGVLAVAFDSRPSAGQVWAAQVALAKGLKVHASCKTASELDGMPKGVVRTAANDYMTDAFDVALKQDRADIFILWSDDDPDSASALAHCKSRGLSALDLKNGLAEITPSETLEVPEVVEMPAIEVELTENEPEDVEDESEEESEDEDDEEDMDVADVLYDAVMEIADIIADLVVQKIKEKRDLS